MQLEFELTFADFSEAILASQPRWRRRGAARNQLWRQIFVALCIGIFIVSVAISVLLERWHKDIHWSARAIAQQIAEVAPWISLIALAFAYQYAARTGGRWGRVTVFVVGAIAVGIGLFVIFFRDVEPGLWEIAWLWVLVIWLQFFTILRRSSNHAFLWAGQSHLHGPKSLQLTDDSFILVDALTKLEYRWQAVRTWGETSNVFLLYISDMAFHIVPKRAFISEEDIASFRKTLATVTGPRAFEVLPLNSSASLPSAPGEAING